MSSRSISIYQSQFQGTRQCPWHRRHPAGKTFTQDEILPNGCCPWLYHTLYPYFLGLQYGARFTYNAEGDCNVGCPAARGVDLIVRKRPYENGLDPRITDHRPVIFADVVAIHGSCPYGHVVGQRILYPLCMNEYYLCPAAFHDAFPLMRLDPPPCIDRREVRCPDWAEEIRYDITGGENRGAD